MAIRIALIHAVTVAIEPVRNAVAEIWPAADCVNLLDDSLSPDRARDSDLTPEMTARIRFLADYALGIGAGGVLFTCSAFGPAIEAAAAQLPIPVLKPNEAMFTEAIGRGRRIGMLATFAPSVGSMTKEFEDAAIAAATDATLRTVLVEPALTALKAGDAETHNHLLAERAADLDDCDVVMLAHFSTSRARRAVEAVLGPRVLTSPDAAVSYLKTQLAGP